MSQQWGLQSHIGLRPALAVTRGGKLAYQAAQKGLVSNGDLLIRSELVSFASY